MLSYWVVGFVNEFFAASLWLLGVSEKMIFVIFLLVGDSKLLRGLSFYAKLLTYDFEPSMI